MTTIAHLSDLHIGTHTHEICRALVEDINTICPDIVCVSGDLTQRALPREFLYAQQLLLGLEYPMVCIPGNHDIPLYNLIERILMPFRKYRKYITPDTQPILVTNNVALICINTSRGYFWKQGIIWPYHRRRVETLCKDLPIGTTKIVVTHHPCVLPAGTLVHRHVRFWKKSLAWMKDQGVELILSGHVHIAGILEYAQSHVQASEQGHSIVISAAGTATSGRTRFEYQSYNLISIDNDTIHIRTRLWNGNAFQESTARSFRRLS